MFDSQNLHVKMKKNKSNLFSTGIWLSFMYVIFTFGCVTGWVYNFIFPQSSPVAHNFPLFDLATVLKSVPSIVSGQIPMVLKLKRQVWVAHSTSRNVIGLVIWRHTVAFPKNGCENWRIFFETTYVFCCHKYSLI